SHNGITGRRLPECRSNNPHILNVIDGVARQYKHDHDVWGKHVAHTSAAASQEGIIKLNNQHPQDTKKGGNKEEENQ
ncbi:hypothetical protein, partial [Yersinia pestis]|uniref:hypothetical protein n=1 Tax=Yersinia pestis TaxID=632 RepID=UPI0027DC8F29